MRSPALFLVAAGVLLSPAWADDNPYNSTGIEPTYYYKGGLNEAVNVFNGNLNVSVPLLTLKGRAGLDLSLTLSYDSRQFKFPVPGSIDWNYQGPTMGRWVPNFMPYVREYLVPISGGWTSDAEVTVETGAKQQLVHKTPPGVDISSDMQYSLDSKILSTKSGYWYNFSNPLRIRRGDPNGNYIDYIATEPGKVAQIVDSLGRSVNIYYEHSTDSSLPTRLTVLNNSGSLLTYTFEYAFTTINASQYGYWGLVSVDSAWVLTRINLPDGKSWIFTYCDGYPGPSGVRLARVDYP